MIVSIVMVVPNGWFISWKIPLINGWEPGVPLFQETPTLEKIRELKPQKNGDFEWIFIGWNGTHNGFEWDLMENRVQLCVTQC